MKESDKKGEGDCDVKEQREEGGVRKEKQKREIERERESREGTAERQQCLNCKVMQS